MAWDVQQNPDRANWTSTQLYEDELLERARAAAQHLEDTGKIVTQQAIADELGMAVSVLRYYPRVEEFLAIYADEEYRAKLREEREDSLYAEVKAAIEILHQRGEVITMKAIGRIVGRAPEGFARYPRVMALIRETQENAETREQEYLARVLSAIQLLEAEGQLVSQAAVGRIVGMSPEGLKRYPAIKPTMDQIAGNFADHAAQRGEELLRLATKTIDNLVERKQIITWDTICADMGLCPSALRHHPRVKQHVSQCVSQYRKHNQQMKKQTTEKNTIEQLYRAEQALEKEGRPITRKAILEQAGVSSRTISRYPAAGDVLNNIVRAHKSE